MRSLMIPVFAVLLAALCSVSQAVYYYAELDKERCFTDTVVTNYTLEIEVQILDVEVAEEIERQNAIARKLGKVQ